MSILGLGLGLLFPAAGIGGLIFKFGARAVFGKARETAGRIPPKAWLAIGVVVAIVAGVVVSRIWLHRHDKAVVSSYEGGIQNQVHAEVNTATAKADAAANVQAGVDAERHAEVVAGVNAAVAAHPVEARHATGPASQAALDRLRRR